MEEKVELYFCPYCGDDFDEPLDLPCLEEYFTKHGICIHWDDSKKFNEF